MLLNSKNIFLDTAKKTLFLLLTLIFLSNNVWANNSSEEWMGELLEKYGIVAGGWYLEKQCNFFDKKKASEFEWRVAQATIALEKLFQNDQMLKTIQKGALSAVSGKKYQNCDNQTHKIVDASFLLAKYLNQQLTKEQYNKSSSDDYILDRYSSIYLVMKLDDKCDIFDKEIKSDVKRVYNETTKKLSKKYPKKMLAAKKKVEAKFSKNSEINCQNIDKNLATSSLKELRSLEDKLKN